MRAYGQDHERVYRKSLDSNQRTVYCSCSRSRSPLILKQVVGGASVEGGWGPSPKEKEKEKRKKKRKKRRMKEKKKKGNYEQRQITTYKVLFFQIFQSSGGIEKLKKNWPPRKGWNDSPESTVVNTRRVLRKRKFRSVQIQIREQQPHLLHPLFSRLKLCNNETTTKLSTRIQLQLTRLNVCGQKSPGLIIGFGKFSENRPTRN